MVREVLKVLDCAQICAGRGVQLGVGRMLSGGRGCSAVGDGEGGIVEGVKEGGMNDEGTLEDRGGLLDLFVEQNARAVQRRHDLFRENLPRGWEIGAQGGYFAFVRHPFGRRRPAEAEDGATARGEEETERSKRGAEGVTAEDVARVLVSKEGVLVLPATFFVPRPSVERGDETCQTGGDGKGKGTHGDNDAEQEDWDEWLRVSVANASDEKVREACHSLARFELK